MNKKISKRELNVSCGIVPVSKKNGKFLILRSKKYWEFPKGKKEVDETDIQTAIRETTEETSIPLKALDFKWGLGYCDTDPYRENKIVRYYIAETNFNDIHLPINPELGRAEHEEFKWVGYTEAKEKLNNRLIKILDWAHEVTK